MNKAVFIFIIIFFSSCSTRDDLDIKDYSIITSINELSEYFDLKIDKSGKYETASITNYFDGSTELEYAYELLESQKYDPLYYSITVDKEWSIKDAKEVYLLGKGALSLVGNSFGQGTKEIDTIKLPGDNSYYALRTLDGEPNGMFYIVRQGRTVYTMMVSGLYTPDHSLLLDLLIPKTVNLDKFEFVKK